MSNSRPESEGAGKTPAEVDPAVEFGETTPTEGTQALPDSADDVLVLLPDGTDGDVPVVETESVDEDLASSQTEMVDTSVPLEDVPLKRANPLMTEIQDEPPPAEQPGGFEDLAAESDEDLFGVEQPVEKPSRPMRRAPDRPRPMPEFFPSAGASTGSRRSWKLPIGLAAAVLLGAGGYVSYPHWRHFIDGGHVAIASPRAGGATAGSTDPSRTPRGGASTGSPSGKTKAVSSDLVRASRDAFREKFLLSVELGYVGEVSNE